MKNTIFHLSTCSTCKRILRTLPLKKESMTLQDIKSTPITPLQLDAIKDMSGSYASLFSKRAVKYRTLGLRQYSLSEADYKRYILQDYTFLKRPIIVFEHEIFIGNAPSTIDLLIKKMKQHDKK